MIRYGIKRIIWLILMLFIIMTTMYFVMSMGQTHSFSTPPKPSFYDNFMMAFQSYRQYISNIIYEWNWGYVGDRNVWDVFLEKMPVTFRINIVVLFSFLTIGITLGVISAVKRHTITDGIISSITMVLNAIPPIFIVFPLIVVFGYELDLLPKQFPIAEPSLMIRVLGYVIPVLALGGPAVSNISRLVRGELIESMDTEYMLLAKVKGLTRKQSILRHGIRNALVPVIPEIPTLFMAVLMNSFFIESIYNIQGLANWFLDSMRQEHYGSAFFLIIIPNAMIISMFYVSMIISLNVVTDISLGLMDPRIKMGEKK